MRLGKTLDHSVGKAWPFASAKAAAATTKFAGATLFVAHHSALTVQFPTQPISISLHTSSTTRSSGERLIRQNGHQSADVRHGISVWFCC